MAKRASKKGKAIPKNARQSARQPKAAAKPSTSVAGKERSTPARSAGWGSPAPVASPFALMRRMAEEMDRAFEDLRSGFLPRMPRLSSTLESWNRGEAAWMPSVEMTEQGGKLLIRADLPGLTSKDIKVEVRDDVVTIQGERRKERESKGKGFYRSERSYGSFYREIPLPEGIDAEQAKASFRNGVLEVTLPAPPRAPKGRRVQVDA